MTTGPEYYAAAQAALAKATRSAEAGYSAKADQELRFAEANMAMARLALDAARAANLRELSSALEIQTDAVQARDGALYDNQNAWIAAVTEGGA